MKATTMLEKSMKGPIAAFCALSIGGCAAMSGGGWDSESYDSSRSYYDDTQGAVVGGSWHERAYLAEEPVQQRSVYDRNPASAEGEEASRKYKRGNRATAEDFVNDSQSEGSLWASGDQTNYYFTKNGLRTSGDIVSIALDDQIIRDIAYEVKRGLSAQEREAELFDAPGRKVASAEGAQKKEGESAKATDARSDADGVKSASQRFAELDLSQSIGLKPGDIMMGEVQERYPNGNYKIRATKRIPYRGSFRMVNFIGIARNTDISQSDQIPSGKFYEYRVKVSR